MPAGVLYWMKEDYFPNLISKKLKKKYEALRYLVTDLQISNLGTVRQLLCHSGSEDFLWAVVQLLGSENEKVAGNAAYVMGTLADSELGLQRLVFIVTAGRSGPLLSQLLTLARFADAEVALNAVGAIGSLADAEAGRAWLLCHPQFEEMISQLKALFLHTNVWVGSNATLVVARITIPEEGVYQLLRHPSVDDLLTALINSLGLDVAGRGMNAAFALGRFCDVSTALNHLVKTRDVAPLIAELANMTLSKDSGSVKNACFALSCLAGDPRTHSAVVSTAHFSALSQRLSDALSHTVDKELQWFSAMALRTFAALPEGNHELKTGGVVLAACQRLVHDTLPEDVAIEVEQIVLLLVPLHQPAAPSPSLTASNEITVSWEAAPSKGVYSFSYALRHVETNAVVYEGPALSFVHGSLQAAVPHTYSVRLVASKERSSWSEPSVAVTTLEAVPGSPSNIKLLAATPSQLRFLWEPPELLNGVLRGYVCTLNSEKKQETKRCTDTNIIFSGLQPLTRYSVCISAHNAKGVGDSVHVFADTLDNGCNLPSNVHVELRGRHEAFVEWAAPVEPLGRINFYEVLVNGEQQYKGTALCARIQMLKADTEYTFVVTIYTSEGKLEAKPVKRKTPKSQEFRERINSLDSSLRTAAAPATVPPLPGVGSADSYTASDGTGTRVRFKVPEKKKPAPRPKLYRSRTIGAVRITSKSTAAPADRAPPPPRLSIDKGPPVALTYKRNLLPPKEKAPKPVREMQQVTKCEFSRPTEQVVQPSPVPVFPSRPRTVRARLNEPTRPLLSPREQVVHIRTEMASSPPEIDLKSLRASLMADAGSGATPEQAQLVSTWLSRNFGGVPPQAARDLGRDRKLAVRNSPLPLTNFSAFERTFQVP